jgi:hypothetical protein
VRRAEVTVGEGGLRAACDVCSSERMIRISAAPTAAPGVFFAGVAAEMYGSSLLIFPVDQSQQHTWKTWNRVRSTRTLDIRYES